VNQVPIKRALVSVYDKTGLTELAGALAAAGVEIVSTGSTAAAIAAAGVPVTRVEQVTGFPECLDGRVKTLHPGVHAGLLADPGLPAHAEQLAGLGIAPFELLVSNLYPFEATVTSGAPPAECVEQIDIGGPAMVRAAAKNHARVAVITDPAMYSEAAAAVAEGGFTLEQRQRLAAQAYACTARYDAAVASWFASGYAPDGTARQTGWPDVVAGLWTRRDVLRYGENPHQGAALYTRPGAPPGLATAEVLHGKAMSYNNYTDAAAAWRAVFDFAEPCVAIIKHANPCGIAVGADLAEAHRKANDCDPVSAYGGVIAANGVVTRAMAAQVAEIFTEVFAAPGFEDAALEILTAKKNLRLLRCPPPGTAQGKATTGGPASAAEWRQLDGGGLLTQTADRLDAPGDDPAAWEHKAGPEAGPGTLADLAFAWRACRAVKSNAILIATGGATVGVGMGQVNRVDSARIAVDRSRGRAKGAVAASDAYFPFADGFGVLADAGVRAVVEPGGSKRDGDVIEAAQASDVSLYFTGARHFFH
jgi:phosphoribosylaminoimidazolecarboxamide formyltransferase/IMP cyclohydrolase